MGTDQHGLAFAEALGHIALDAVQEHPVAASDRLARQSPGDIGLARALIADDEQELSLGLARQTQARNGP